MHKCTLCPNTHKCEQAYMTFVHLFDDRWRNIIDHVWVYTIMCMGVHGIRKCNFRHLIVVTNLGITFGKYVFVVFKFDFDSNDFLLIVHIS